MTVPWLLQLGDSGDVVQESTPVQEIELVACCVLRESSRKCCILFQLNHVVFFWKVLYHSGEQLNWMCCASFCLRWAHSCSDKNNKRLKCKEWRPVHKCGLASRKVSTCLNRKCGSEAGWGWLIKHFIIKICDDITRGKERGRGWPRFPCYTGEAFLAFAQMKVCFLFHGKLAEKPHKYNCRCHRIRSWFLERLTADEFFKLFSFLHTDTI